MTLTAEEVVRSTFAAYRLALFDTRGLTLFDGSREAAIRSFWVAAFLSPIWVIATLVLWQSLSEQPDVFRMVAVKTIFYVISWTAFPVLVALIAFAVYQAHRFPLFLAVYNWSHMIQAAILLPLTLLHLVGILPDMLVNPMYLGFVCFVVAYEAFIIRTTLKIGWGEAIGLGVLDVALAFMLQSIENRMAIGL